MSRFEPFGTATGTLAAAALVAALGTAAGCHIGAVPPAEHDASRHEAKAAAKKAEAKPSKPEFDPTKTFAWKVRTVARQVRELLVACRKAGLDKLDEKAALRVVPAIDLAAARQACEPLFERYEALAPRYRARHFTVDAMLTKMARLADAFDLMAYLIEKRGKPSKELSETVGVLRRTLEDLDGTIDALTTLRMSAQPRDEVAPQRVTRGKFRVTVERMVRNDAADVGTLYDKWVKLGMERLLKRLPVARRQLEHFGALRARWVKNHRKLLEALSTGDERFDRTVRRVAGRYLDTAEFYVALYQQLAKPLIDGRKLTRRELKSMRRKLKSAHDQWKKAHDRFFDELVEAIQAH